MRDFASYPFPIIHSNFLILPGEVRRVVIAPFHAAWIFSGLLRSPDSFAIIDARSSDGGRIFFHELPEAFDLDDAADWLTFITFMKPGEAIHLLVKNVSDRAAHYRVRLR